MSKDQAKLLLRRDFMRALSSTFALFAAASVGCGGGSGAGPGAGASGAGGNGGDGNAAGSGGFGNGGGGGNGGMGGNGGGTTVDLGASVSAILGFVNGLLGLSQAARRAQLFEFLNARPELLSAGISTDGVWGIYGNGVPLMILDNREPDVVPPDLLTLASALPAPGSDVPKGTRARLINTMGNSYVDETQVVGQLLRARGYATVSDPGTVESLRTLSGDSVLYFSAHGGVCQVPVFDLNGNVQVGSDGKPVITPSFGVWTKTPFDSANPNQYLTDLQAGTLGIGIELNDYSADRTQVLFAAHYWVTDQWANTYFSFNNDSLVWISACYSTSGIAQPFREACLAKGAGLYAGWTNVVFSNAALLGAKFVLDRLLGANLASPKEAPPQRAFDYGLVWADLRARGLHIHPSTNGGTTELTYTAKASAKFGLLAPSIAYVLVDEGADEAVLRGLFGKPPENERAVLVGGLEAAVHSWEETEIRVALPRTGTGSAGDVVVQVRGHASNVRRITEWNLQFRYSWAMANLAPCKVEGPVTVRFRADVAEYRTLPGKNPEPRLAVATTTRDSSAFFTAGGTFNDGSCSINYSGSGELVPGGYPENSQATLIIASMWRVDSSTREAALALAVGGRQPLPWIQTTTCPGSPEVKSEFAVAFGLLEEIVEYKNPFDDSAPGASLPSLILQLTDEWGVTGGVFEEVESSLKIRLEWDAAPAKFPPDPDAAR